MSTVFQEWFHEMPWKMQSIFVNGLRAPDSHTKNVKKCVRWMRVSTCNNADPSKPDCYMSAPQMNEEIVAGCVDECEYITCHYVHHLADSMRVLSIYHPDESVRNYAANIHFQIAEEIFHFVPETTEQFVYRHRDKVEHK